MAMWRTLLLAAVCPIGSARVPSPVTQLWPSPQFWPINYAFPGIKTLSEDPPIFVVDDLLDEETCERLIAKATPHLRQSLVQTEDGYVPNPSRTSSDSTVDWSEVVGLQTLFSDLLAMPTSHFEPLKVTKYREGEAFLIHHDGLPEGSADGLPICTTPYCNRVVTLFVYLRECESGGATDFPGVDPALSIQPKRGMGVVHFPSYMPARDGERDERVLHEGAAAIDEKWICQQWGWTGPLVREALPESMLGRRWDDTLL